MAKRELPRQIMVIDPTMQYERRLRYMEKHAVWEIFKVVFWGIYVFIMGVILLIFNLAQPSPNINVYAYFGYGLTIFAIFYILWGFAISLHLRLMRRYA